LELNLKGRSVLITGASRGIGLGIAEVFASEGCNLHLASRSADSLGEASKHITSQYKANVNTYPCDLSVDAEAVRLAKEVGPVDVLVNNAGAIPHGHIEDAGIAKWREAWALKVFGYISLTREIYRVMRERKRGVIVNIVGTAGERPRASHLSGSMANAALMAMTQALGAEAPSHGVRVVAINPGPTETSRQIIRWKAKAKKELGDENRWRELTKSYPLGRLGTVDEVASTVVFVCSNRSGYTSGTVITIDGGDAARPPARGE
jgi:NAD(P)-dependent dehydrogenase (short-subunit alcohol dehydrogenase family)